MSQIWIMLVILHFVWPGSLAQSLGEAARREAARRKQLEQQGVEGKEIDAEKVAHSVGGSLTTSKIPESPRPVQKRETASRGLPSAANYRLLLKKLDNEIRLSSDRLARLRERVEAEKQAISSPGRLAGEKTRVARERRLAEVRELETKLKRLNRERLEVYDAGLKAGFFPGELDGHGIMP